MLGSVTTTPITISARPADARCADRDRVSLEIPFYTSVASADSVSMWYWKRSLTAMIRRAIDVSPRSMRFRGDQLWLSAGSVYELPPEREESNRPPARPGRNTHGVQRRTRCGDRVRLGLLGGGWARDPGHHLRYRAYAADGLGVPDQSNGKVENRHRLGRLFSHGQGVVFCLIQSQRLPELSVTQAADTAALLPMMKEGLS